MNNTWLFFAPRSNETSRENFLATLESGYPLDEVKQFLSEDEQRMFEQKKKLYIWGNQEAKSGSWKKMQIGDYVAFYAKGEFVYVGRCVLKKQSTDLARQLWGNVPNRDVTWEYTFFLDEIRPISIPLSVVIELAGYKEKMIIQGFMPINEEGMTNILKKYGSLPSFFDAYSSGIQTKDFALLDKLSTEGQTNDKDLEEMDKIFLGGNPDIILKEFEQRLSNERPDVVETKVMKIKRNQTVVKKMKEKYNSKCQICGFTFKKKDGGYYSEVAHIRPIYSTEMGVDTPSNMIVLCPNHHKMLDLGNVEILSTTTYKIDGETKNLEQPLFT
jgi:hypothetical protein